MRTITFVLAAVPVIAACSDDATAPNDGRLPRDGGGVDASSNPGFPVPTAVTKANMRSQNTWIEIGDADWSCLDTPSDDQPSTHAIMLSGQLDDFQTGNPVGNATITAFPGIMLTGNSGMATTSNVAATRGQYSMTLAVLPAGQTRFGFKVEASNYLKTYLLGHYLDPARATQARNLEAWSEGTVNALPAFIGVTHDVSKGTVTGALRDCAGREVSNAVATVSATAGTATHLQGADTYYFSAGGTSLPVRHSVAATMNKDGMFLVLGLPPQSAPAFIQVWGFPTAADLSLGAAGVKLLAEQPSPIESNAIVDAALEPRRN